MPLSRSIRTRRHSRADSNAWIRTAAVSLAVALNLIALGAAFAAEPTPDAPRHPAAQPEPPAADTRGTAAPRPNPRFTGTPFVTTWTAEDYGGAPINYHVAQHPLNGFIYVANNFGVLEFDGAAWRVVPFHDGGVVPIVVIDLRAPFGSLAQTRSPCCSPMRAANCRPSL